MRADREEEEKRRNTGGEREFTFDYSFWSHDEFNINE